MVTALLKGGISCTGWKISDCDFVLCRTIAKKKLSDAQPKALAKTGATKEINGFVSRKPGEKFSAQLVLDENHKAVFAFAETTPPTVRIKNQ